MASAAWTAASGGADGRIIGNLWPSPGYFYRRMAAKTVTSAMLARVTSRKGISV
jgi:hypothetical protein